MRAEDQFKAVIAFQDGRVAPFDLSVHEPLKFAGSLNIFDMDGCLVNDDHRHHLIRKDMPVCDEAFEDYHAAMIHDTYNPNVRNEVIRLQNGGNGVRFAIVTARPEKWVHETVVNLIKADILPEMAGHRGLLIVMRANGCTTPSPELKRNVLKWMLGPESIIRGTPLMVGDIAMYDDRVDILAECSKIGISAIHATAHDIKQFNCADSEPSLFEQLEQEMQPQEQKYPVVLVTGSKSGLGAAIVHVLQDSFQVIEYDVEDGDDVACPSPWLGDLEQVDVLINCAGINLNVWVDQLSPLDHQRVMDVNANSIVYMTQALLPQLIKSKGTVINIVSNAANMPMTSSTSYNMSKAAALMATKQLAHELTPKCGLTIFSISPNKLAGTKMSRYIENNVCKVRGWSPEFAKEYQQKSLMHGQETDVYAVARLINHLLVSGDSKYLSGCDIPFGK